MKTFQMTNSQSAESALGWNQGEPPHNRVSRFFHRLKGRYYFRLAAKSQCELHEHILIERSRIAACLHRAAWHFSMSKPGAEINRSKNEGTSVDLPATALDALSEGLNLRNKASLHELSQQSTLRDEQPRESR